MFRHTVRSATSSIGRAVWIQSTSMNCSAPEMLVALVRNAQSAGSRTPLFAASSTPAAKPMVV